MKQITIMVNDDQQANQIVDILSDFDAVQSIDIDPTWSNGEAGEIEERIIETDSGPMINHSRVSVYDVMQAHDEGHSIFEIHQIYNLSSSQIQAALNYIKQHRAALEPKLKEIIEKLSAREKQYRTIAEEREKIAPSEMTPERAKLKSLIKESQAKRRAV